jgi:hypothetical protein
LPPSRFFLAAGGVRELGVKLLIAGQLRVDIKQRATVCQLKGGKKKKKKTGTEGKNGAPTESAISSPFLPS